LHEAVELSRKSNGEARGFTWFLSSEWGRARAAQGRLKEAEAIQRQALAKLSQIMGPDAYQNCLIADALADTLEKNSGNLDEVIRLRPVHWHSPKSVTRAPAGCGRNAPVVWRAP
jgi:serine/threonine-protein kinase